jgi:hypothetical protein
MSPLPTPPNYDTLGKTLAAERERASGVADQMRDLKAPLRADYKPAWWKKALAVPVGALAGHNAPMAVDALLNGPYNRARTDYESKHAGLEDQLNYERNVGIPLAEQQAKLPQTDFENRLQTARESTQRAATTGRLSYLETHAQDIKNKEGKFIAGSEQEDPASPTGWTATTVGGETKPFTPKSATATPKLPKTWQDAYSAASVATDPKEAERLTKLGDTMYQKELSFHQAERAPTDTNGMSPTEQRDFNAQTRRYQPRIDALEKQRALYVGSDNEADKKALAAIDQELEDTHGKIDAAEQSILSRRKAGAPGAANAVPPGLASQIKPEHYGQRITAGGKQYDVSTDGKTITPVPSTKK